MLKKKRMLIGNRMQAGFGPNGSGGDGQPSDKELRFCSWGFLMASVWFSDPDVPPPTKEYLEALAELQGLKIPTMSQLPAEFKKSSLSLRGRRAYNPTD